LGAAPELGNEDGTAVPKVHSNSTRWVSAVLAGSCAKQLAHSNGHPGIEHVNAITYQEEVECYKLPVTWSGHCCYSYIRLVALDKLLVWMAL